MSLVLSNLYLFNDVSIIIILLSIFLFKITSLIKIINCMGNILLQEIKETSETMIRVVLPYYISKNAIKLQTSHLTDFLCVSKVIQEFE